jgi:phosphoribosyl 1,2-cyclic phosphodiesterase
MELRPTIKIICGIWLVESLLEINIPKKNTVLLPLDETFDFGKYQISLFEAKHDVPNCGFKIIITKTNYKIFHATDINSLQDITAKNYDLYCLEANYDEEELKTRLKEKEDAGEYAYEHRVLQTHLSKEECNRFLIENMGNNSECIYLHQHIDKQKEEKDNEQSS